MRLLLERADCAVTEAEHGAAALELIQVSMPHVLVTDLSMPVMPGVELMRRVRSATNTASLPIVAVSADPLAIRSSEVSVLADAAIPKESVSTTLAETVMSLRSQAA